MWTIWAPVRQHYQNFLLERACLSEESEDQKECWAEHVTQRIVENDVVSAFRSLAYLYENRLELRRDCSEVGILVARNLSEYDFDPHTTQWAPESAYCNFSFYKEYPRVVLLRTKDVEQVSDFCSVIAETFPEQLRYSIDCYRGIGYALPFIVSGTDGHTVIQNVIEICERIVKRPEDREGCAEGGFNRVAYREREHSLFTGSGEGELSLCATQVPRYRDRCYGTYKGAAFLDTEDSEKSLSDVVRSTKGGYAGHPELKELFAQIAWAYGYQRVYQNSVHISYEDLVDMCTTEDAYAYQQCLYGLADGLAKNGTPGSEYRDVVALCEVIEGRGDYKCVNDSSLAFLRTYYGLEKFREACNVFGKLKDEIPCS
jgi:hypothetical protein